MTGLDPSPNKSYGSRSCSRRQSASQSTEQPDVRNEGPVRRSKSMLARARSATEDSSATPVRHHERGHPLPNSHNPAPKDAIPFRNQHLGLPSHRRHMEFTSGCSPQRRMTYSNFRRSDSQPQTNPSSPDARSAYTSPSRKDGSRSRSRRRGSTSQGQATSSRRQSGISSPTDRPTQSSQRHSLDSEKLYSNLTSIANSPSQRGSRHNTEADGYYNGSNSGHTSRHSRRSSARNSGASSPRRRRDSISQVSEPNAVSTKTRRPRTSETHARVQPDRRSESTHSSTHSLLSPASPQQSQSPSPSRHSSKPQPAADVPPPPREESAANATAERSKSTIRRGLEAILCSPDEKKQADRSASPAMTFEDYVIIADIPRTPYVEGEENVMPQRRPQSQSPRRDYQHRASRSDMPDGDSDRRDSEERGRGRERGRDRSQRERKKQADTKKILNDLNFKKGWIFRLDDDEEWRKYWFVLTDSRFKYYRDSQAEERDELEGELDLCLCTDIIECDVEKNYGFQLHTRESIITLSAMTSKIRKNWIDILRRNISGNPPDQYNGSKARGDQDGSNQLTAPLSSRRESGVGRDQEHERRLEYRTRWFQEGIVCTDGENSRWDTIELKKGTIKPTDRTDGLAENIPESSEDIDKKWEDFEKMQIGETQSLDVADSSNYDSTIEEEPPSSPSRQVRFGEPEESSSTTSVGGPCGPNAPCGPRMRALEKIYKETLEATQREHEKQMERLQKETERLLMEESQAAAKTIDALRKAHQEELAKARGGAGRDGLTDSRMPL
ncbi:hypothetical protein ACEWY4_018047 [Coilia grayii]|uniref:PH domain-containing protein n=1 Tax=Coilia grayii TaxID=363190 RepID=A0ABD1JM20_9TELE